MIRKGTYVLFLRFLEDRETEVGSLGRIRFLKGDYCYVGSAMGGLDQRVGRHLSKEKNIRWHIDHLTSICDEIFAYEIEDDRDLECSTADLMYTVGNVPAVKGFGCSDCKCATHLFRADFSATISVLVDNGFRKYAPKT